MKHLLKEISLTTLAVMLSAHMVPGFAIGATLWQNIIVGLIMTLGYLIVLPMAKVLLIPFVSRHFFCILFARLVLDRAAVWSGVALVTLLVICGHCRAYSLFPLTHALDF
jgi:hypothetical protein